MVFARLATEQWGSTRLISAQHYTSLTNIYPVWITFITSVTEWFWNRWKIIGDVCAVLLHLAACLFTSVQTTSIWPGHQYACGFKPGAPKTATLHSMFIAMSALPMSYCGLHYCDTMLQSSKQAPTVQRNYYLQTAALYHNPDTILIFNLNWDNCTNSVNPKH